MPVFLKHFVNELSDLANGTDFEDDTGQPIPSVCRIQSIVPDLPAKALFLNIKQFNGQFDCSTCKHLGRYDRELKARVCEYTTDTLSLRTAEESRRLANIAERTGHTLFGIKGSMPLDNFLTSLIMFQLTGCTVSVKEFLRGSFLTGGSIQILLQNHTAWWDLQ